MNALVKFCGLTRHEDVLAADAAGAHMLGFIMAESPRRITPALAAEISLGVAARRVAVTVDATEAELAHICEIFSPDYIQFHGDEPLEHVLNMGSRFEVGTIKAAGIRGDADMKLAETYAACDYILYDAKPPEGARVRGGHGVAIDWDIIARNPTPRRYLLAGGLTPENVAQAVAATGAPMVDVSSGVESAPGVKDAARMAAFMAALKGR